MKYAKLREVLFSTKNYTKIIKEFNKLTPREKEDFLRDAEVKKRISKIADINFLLKILIDLSWNFRIEFLNTINLSKYRISYEEIIINFLCLKSYEDFDYQKLLHFNNLNDKHCLPLMFKKLSPEKLKSIILANYKQFINNYAFVEYNRKIANLNLEANLLNNVTDSVLFTELKARRKNKKSVNMDINEFMSLNISKQNGILSNGRLPDLENEVIKVLLEKYMYESIQSLTEIFNSILKDFQYINLLKLQTIIYIIDDDTALKLIKKFFEDILKCDFDIEEKYLKALVFNFRKLSSKTSELFKLTKAKPFAIINYLNTGIIDEKLDDNLSKTITITEYQKVNNKKINKIINMLDKLCAGCDEYNEVINLSYKLYFIFGYHNSIELLDNKFGQIDYKTLKSLLSRCEVKNVGFKLDNNSYEPDVNQYFIQFLLGDKRDKNATLKRILRGEADIIKDSFANIYNNFARFQQMLGAKIHLNKLIPLLEKNLFTMFPDEYKITKDIINNIIKSHGYADLFDNQINSADSKEYVIEACNFYHAYLEKRISSAIPRVMGKTKDGYSYEVIKLDDPIIMTLGYITGCCFRLNGASKEFLRYCSESVYARVIVIRNENDEICSIIPIVRNGNVIAGNSIETNSKGVDIKVYRALKYAYDDILKVSASCEEKPIIAGLVTNMHARCYSSSPVKNRIYPIRNSEFYTNYNWQAYIVSIENHKSETDFELYSPDAIYFDERPEILLYYSGMKNLNIKTEVEKRVGSILYKLDHSYEEFMRWAAYVVCGEDWVLKVSYDGILGYYLEKDPRAVEEYNAVKNYLELKLADKMLYEINLTDDNFNSLKTNKLILEKKNYLQS